MNSGLRPLCRIQGKRVEFASEEDRKQFFQELRENCQVTSWQALADKFGLRRTLFQKYQYGQILLSGALFARFLGTFSEERKQFFLGKIRFKDKSWGAVKGGRQNYARHPEIYDARRNKGIQKIAEMRKQGLINRERILDFNTPLSEDLCEFIGAFIGDGFASAVKFTRWVGMCGDLTLDRDYLTRYLPERIKSFFILNAISKGDVYARDFYHKAIHLYSEGKQRISFLFKRQIPIHSKNSFNKLISFIKELGGRPKTGSNKSELVKQLREMLGI